MALTVCFISPVLITPCGAVAEWLVRWTPDRTIRVKALAGALCCVLMQDTLLS